NPRIVQQGKPGEQGKGAACRPFPLLLLAFQDFYQAGDGCDEGCDSEDNRREELENFGHKAPVG
ncbi:hypothetical protein, partial [Klebsiella pneumoniae]